MIQGPALVVWQVFLFAIFISAIIGFIWFLASSFLRASIRYKFILLLAFSSISILAMYGCWLEGNPYLSQHHYNDSGLNAFQNICVVMTFPGDIVAALVYASNDVPENDPDSWQSAWLVAPTAALIWASVLSVFGKGLNQIRTRFGHPTLR